VEIWQAALVGIVQGLTEFLPISSSAHIMFAERLLGVSEAGLQFTIIVHFGTLLAVCIALWHRLVPVTIATFSGLVSLLRGRSPWNDVNFRWGAYIILGTIPAAVIGLLLEDQIGEAFDHPRWAAAYLAVTGVILFATHFATPLRQDVTLRRAIVIGFAQALAILPGISRSGTTISVGLLLGVDRRKAAEFSFLLAIPIILGPSILTLLDISSAVTGGDTASIWPLLTGMLCAMGSGILAIKLLLRFVQSGKLLWFAYYCWIVGGLGIMLF
jgi:undecaprenyl-diphosphatase